MNTVTWTDDKIDVLDGKVDALDTRVGVLEKKVDVGFARTDERFIAINQQLADLKTGQAQLIDRFDGLLGKFAALQHTLMQIGFSMVVALVGGLIALIVAVVATH